MLLTTFFSLYNFPPHCVHLLFGFGLWFVVFRLHAVLFHEYEVGLVRLGYCTDTDTVFIQITDRYSTILYNERMNERVYM